ncbi:peptidyl-prolyl cis-trans isomerase [Camponotus floridanus]|uniref:peptidyl-prolyl cis-trans isomerase n=1 Tax=Camponotus floridanus TaxID=104421 RepID=UPI000DC69B93|nr:peptidyl-prolyl cis-trans isomerase [Camponotus floridanus]
MNNEKRKKSRHVYISSKIDNKPPYFNASAHLKAFDLQDAIRVKEIDKENMNLLKKINIIHRLGGYVDCWAPDIKYNSKLENQDLIERLSVASDERQLAEKSQTRCFFDVGLKEENQKLGRIIFELYDSIVPRTCENFAAFCRGINGLSYKHTPFHRIVSGYWCQGGDVTKFDGTGGISIYGNSFDKEKSNLRHTEPGILSMCDNDDGRNDSKFNLTFKCLKTVNEDRAVFGRVIGGMRNIYKIEEFGTKTGKPIKSVIVLNCGVLSTKRPHEKLSKSQI